MRAPLSYVCGRPPFGYRVQDKQLHVHLDQAADVTRVFDMIRRKNPIRTVVEVMQALELKKPKPTSEDVPVGKRKTGPFGKARKPKAPFWDRKKIARILEHAPLYCTGLYKIRGRRMTLPNLVFLPPGWADTAVAVPPAAAAGTMAGTRSTP